jgi:cobalt/nickel transport protein
MMSKAIWLAAGVGVLCAGPALAHFQSIYTPEANYDAPAIIPIDLIFWHPLSSGAVMNMATPQRFFMVHDGQQTDLLGMLKPMKFTSWNNSGDGFQAQVSVDKPGDYIFAMVPQPYYQDGEDIYIQQTTKAYVNRGGFPTDWDVPLGLKAEIVPHNKPYNIITGSSFSGQVLYDGKPVPGAEIEVEYVAAPPDMTTGKTGQPTFGPMPGGAIVALADDNGFFTFTVPKAGWWGFAALDLAGDTSEFNGKHWSQDAVIWVNASDLPSANGGLVAVTGGPGTGATQVALAGGGFSPDLEDAVAKSIRDQLRPIRTDLALYRAETSYPVTLGGLGFIVGLAGLGFYLFARQRARQGSGQRV